MQYHYSRSTNAFYPTSLLENYKKAGSLPEDIVPVDESVFREFTAVPAAGMRRVSGSDGMPTWEEIPPKVLTEDEVKNQARGLRDGFISATDRMLVSDYTINDIILTEKDRQELLDTRLAFKQWPSLDGWPVISLPDIPQWLLIEAVNNGYRVYDWPI